VSDDRELTAGDFSSWIDEMQTAIRDEGDSDVPCNGCTACCRSSQFVHIGPDESDTLARIPASLLFPAPGRPRGHVVLGYDERGHCPMLVDDACSIYADRPKACRTYDCRVFAASGLDAGTDKVEITRRARRWEFSFSDEDARIEHEAIRATASFLDVHIDLLRDAGIPANQTEIAVLAIALHDLFWDQDEQTGATKVVEPDPSVIRTELIRRGNVTR
jgi:Fe-S-cluster containining protein